MPIRSGITFNYLGTKVDQEAGVLRQSGTRSTNMFAAGIGPWFASNARRGKTARAPRRVIIPFPAQYHHARLRSAMKTKGEFSASWARGVVNLSAVPCRIP